MRTADAAPRPFDRRALLLATVVAVGLLILWTALRQKPQAADILALLPQDTAVVAQWRVGLNPQWPLGTSLPGSLLNSLDWPLALSEYPDAAALLTRLRQDMASLASPAMAAQLGSDEGCLALLRPDANTPLADNLLYAFRLPDRPLSRRDLSLAKGDDVQVREEVREGHTLRCFQRHDTQLGCTLVAGNWYLSARTMAPLLRVIGQHRQHTLATVSEVAAALEELGDHWSWRVHIAFPVLADRLAPEDDPPFLRRLSLALFPQEKGQRWRLRLDHASAGARPNEIPAPWELPPPDKLILPQVPGSVVWYAWCSWLTPKLWEQWFTSAIGSRTSQLLSDRQRTEALHAAPPWSRILGRQVALLVTDTGDSSTLAVPQLGIMVEVRDRQGLEERLRAMLVGLPLQQEVIEGMTTQVLMLAGGLFRPAFALHDNFFLLADSREQLAAILRGAKHHPLLTQDDFLAVLPRQDQADSLRVFLRPNRLVPTFNMLLPRIATLLLRSEEPTSRQVLQKIQTLAAPLWHGLANYTLQGLRAHGRDGILVLETTLRRDA